MGVGAAAAAGSAAAAQQPAHVQEPLPPSSASPSDPAGSAASGKWAPQAGTLPCSQRPAFLEQLREETDEPHGLPLATALFET
eukprot:NODE_8968_length_336_cov_21.867596_g7207_i0.p2 GENE.NODE_8968_length_336_cov_21.867596_g7207_i0~~NODE_8968_length_336_cov_21.867596_g7207_i0.p2  ORF type:complete len:90 (+),score=29.61 NODE_8968_length_336_cov_21.867596_g7207_i0:23-271(+)